MAAQVQITQLPAAGPLTGAELVPVVQNGVTAQTTTSAISGAGALNYPFLTVGSTVGLTQARQIAPGAGLVVSDGGAGGSYSFSLTGAALSLNSSPVGIQVKTSASVVTSRTLGVGAGLLMADGDGVAGNPTITLGAALANLAGQTGTGILAIQSGTYAKITLQGTSNQITVTDGNGASNPVFAIASNPVIPGTGAMRVPVGTTAQQPAGSNGLFRFNDDTQTFDGYSAGQWRQFSLTGGVTTFSTGSTGLSPIGPAAGAVTLGGILNPASGGTGVNNGIFTTTLSGNVSFGGAVTTGGALTTSGALTTTGAFGITLAATSNTSLTLPVSGTLATLAGSETLTNKTLTSPVISTIVNSGTLTLPTSTDTLVGRATTDTLTNKSISGSTNTLSNIGNASLTNSSVTIGTTSVSLGATSLTLGGLTSVAVTQDPVSALQLATKQYVDSVAQGLNVKAAVAWGTTANINLSGLGTQAGGEWTGPLTAGDRILVKNQSTQANNGIYAAASSGWTRTADADSWDELVSAFVFVQQGATLGDTGWVCTIDAGGTLGVTAITWAQFSGAGTYTAGTGLTLTGTQFSLTSPVVASLGGTGQSSYAVGDLLYASASTTLSKLALGTTNYVLTAGASAPQYVDQSTLSVGSATNAANTAITANSTNATNYLTFVSATTGNLPQLVNSGITCNPSTGQITGGVAGGAF